MGGCAYFDSRLTNSRQLQNQMIETPTIETFSPEVLHTPPPPSSVPDKKKSVLRVDSGPLQVQLEELREGIKEGAVLLHSLHNETKEATQKEAELSKLNEVTASQRVQLNEQHHVCSDDLQKCSTVLADIQGETQNALAKIQSEKQKGVADIQRETHNCLLSLNGIQAGALAAIGPTIKMCHQPVQPPHVRPNSNKLSGESSVWSTSATKILSTLKTPSMVTLGTLGTTLGTSTLFQLCGLPSPQVYAQFLSTLVSNIPGGLWLYILLTLVLFGGIYLCMSRIQACLTRFCDSVSNQLSEMWHSTKTKCSEIGDSICTKWKNVTDTILKGWSKFCSFCSNYWPAFQWCLYVTIGMLMVFTIVYYWTPISTFFAAAYTTVSPYITTAKDMSMNATNTIITTTSDGYEWTLSTWVKPSSQEWYDYLSFQAKRLAQEAAEKEAASATTMGMVTSFFAKSLKSTSVRNIREAAVTMGGSITMGLGIIAFVLCFE